MSDLGGLADAFLARFGAAPTRLVRAPGRVNLIGDHIDYNGLAVLPMAIQHEIRMLVAPRDDGQVRLANVDEAFEPVSFELGPGIPAHPAGHWVNYAKAAGQALVTTCGPLGGVDALVTGTIPRAAGLSSSSALVVAAALALVDANDLDIAPHALMALLADAEYYVGTRGGGMDQAICLGARRGAATRIDFRPLRLTPVAIPEGWRFVVGFSGVGAQKSAEARDVYNRRPRECAEALPILAEAAGLGHEATWPALVAAGAVERAAALVAELDPPLDRRARHVITEAARVEAAVAALGAGDADGFGRLMTASHASLRDDYEVSCPELDRLVDLALDAGARGARLTGAGFGGSVVALADEDTAVTVASHWQDTYCRPRGLTDAVFVAEPSGGASVAGA
jgi:galactokinase